MTGTPTAGAETAAEQHIHATAAALGPGVELDRQSATVEECDDPDDGGPAGRVFVARRYWVHHAGRDAFDQVAAHWAAGGYRIIKDGRALAYPHLWVEHPDDGYRVGLDRNTAGDLLLGASSPCFWPAG